MTFPEAHKLMGKLTPELRNKISKCTDGLLSCATRRYQLDIIKLDDMLSAGDDEYDNVECTYKGKPEYSISKYISEKYGKETHKIILKLIKS